MDVFPELIGEKELTYFTPEDYYNLRGVLNDVLAKDICDYMASPEANPAVVESIQKYLGPTVESYTLHFVLQDKGIVDLIRSLVPEQIGNLGGRDLEPLIEKLTFLEENEDKIMTSIPPRTKVDFDNFMATMNAVVSKMKSAGDTPTYPDVIARIKDNKSIFYIPNEKAHDTGVRIVSSKKRQWFTALRGARYIQRCEAENISLLDRRKF